MFTKKVPFVCVRIVDFFFRDMSARFFLSLGGLREEFGFEERDGVFRGGLTCSWMRRGANGAPKAEGRMRFFLGGDFVDSSGGIGLREDCVAKSFRSVI
jgi:hypothetical protein